MNDFYNTKKYCSSCEGYVNYLMSVDRSYCTQCGGEVRLFSKDDWTGFSERMTARRPKGGRPRKAKTARRSA